MDRLDFKGKNFELTNDHVREGIRKDGGECPLALALRDFFFYAMNLEDDPNLDDLEINVDFKTVSVEYVAINEESDPWTYDFIIDNAVSDFIHDFDDECIAYREFEGRTVHIELLEDQHYKLSFVQIVYYSET